MPLLLLPQQLLQLSGSHGCSLPLLQHPLLLMATYYYYYSSTLKLAPTTESSLLCDKLQSNPFYRILLLLLGPLMPLLAGCLLLPTSTPTRSTPSTLLL